MVHLPDWLTSEERDAFHHMVDRQVRAGERAVGHFAIAIGAVVALYAVGHWTQRLSLHNKAEVDGRLQVVERCRMLLRRCLSRQRTFGIAIKPSRFLLALAYAGLNIGVSIWKVDWSVYTVFANRLGWVSIANMLLAILLGLKNTPLSPIAGRSYETLNVFHRWCGLTTIGLMVLHTILYIVGLFKYDSAWLLTTSGTYGADIAGVAMLLILATANAYIRKQHYEFFYVMHIFLVTLIVITVCYHTSKAARSALILALVAAGLYTLDRGLRLSRWTLGLIRQSTATLTPLPCGATRVTLDRRIRAQAGSHAFLYLPGIAAWQAHPFTMVTRDPVEFVVVARNGFTKKLHERASAEPGMRLRAAIEGPYGNVPDVRVFERVVIFAGGSGATFAFALAAEWSRCAREVGKGLVIVWSVRDVACLQWFAKELAALLPDPRVKVILHVTQSSNATARPVESKVDPSLHWDVEKSESTPPLSSWNTDIGEGRPDVDAIIKAEIAAGRPTDRILVAACGPSGLIQATTSAAMSYQGHSSLDGPGVELHVEAFSL